MYADDVVLLSNTKSGLQNCLNSLHLFCEDWKLTVNIDKTQVIIFNKGGKLLKNNVFLFNNIPLQNVQEYKYLGIMFRASGTFSKAVDVLRKKALKVIFMIKRNFQGDYAYPKLLLKLFDSCVRPILLYGSELWGTYVLNIGRKLNSNSNISNILEKSFEDFSPENIHTRFCKYVLGVSKYASNIASRAELGRFPITIFVLIQSIKYWLYLYDKPFINFSKLAYNSLIHNDCNHQSTFNHNIGVFLKHIGFGHVWENKTTLSKPKLFFALKKCLTHRYEQYFDSVCIGDPTKTNRSKLKTYKSFKNV